LRWTRPPPRRRCSPGTRERRYAYNQSLRLVLDALAAKQIDPAVVVPWSGFDLINAFNAWKKTEDAGCVFVVAADGTSTKRVTGLAWRHEVAAQVFEEAAVDLGRALAAYSQSRSGSRKGQRMGFPRRKRKGRCRDSFRLRNNKGKGGSSRIRIGEVCPARWLCRGSARSGFTMTPAGCGGCSVPLHRLTPTPGSRSWRPGPTSCPPPSTGMAAAGM
jgi:hypothetical protein